MLTFLLILTALVRMLTYLLMLTSIFVVNGEEEAMLSAVTVNSKYLQKQVILKVPEKRNHLKQIPAGQRPASLRVVLHGVEQVLPESLLGLGGAGRHIQQHGQAAGQSEANLKTKQLKICVSLCRLSSVRQTVCWRESSVTQSTSQASPASSSTGLGWGSTGWRVSDTWERETPPAWTSSSRRASTSR